MSVNYLEIIKEALSEVLEQPVDHLSEDMQVDREFDLDSVMFVQFLLSIEDRVPNLRFDPEALTEASFNQVSALLAFVQSAGVQNEAA